jgi:chloramphenicol 3-O-phosphotransferase
MRSPAIVHLIGFPASGKLTIARALADVGAASGGRIVVLDNHHINNVIFAALDIDGVKPVPGAVWERIGEIREVLLRTVDELSPPEWSFVFTNVVTDDKPSERAAVDQLVDLARRTNRNYLAVVLHCPTEVLLERVANIDRRDRSKWIDPSSVSEFIRTHRLVDVTDLAPLTIDTSSTDPTDAALLILERLDDARS